MNAFSGTKGVETPQLSPNAPSSQRPPVARRKLPPRTQNGSVGPRTVVGCQGAASPESGSASNTTTRTPKRTRSWTACEDQHLTQLMRTETGDDTASASVRCWSRIASLMEGRTGKQCRERWLNQLKPGISHDAWTPAEEQLLHELHARYGNKWVQIAMHLPGKTENCVKNRWNSNRRKELRRLRSASTPRKASAASSSVRQEQLSATDSPGNEKTRASPRTLSKENKAVQTPNNTNSSREPESKPGASDKATRGSKSVLGKRAASTPVQSTKTTSAGSALATLAAAAVTTSTSPVTPETNGAGAANGHIDDGVVKAKLEFNSSPPLGKNST